MIEYNIPIRLVSIVNLREHWAVRARRAHLHRKAAIIIKKHQLPCRVEIIRCGKKLMDGDNLQIASKSLRDGIADQLGVDDADPRIDWVYSQIISKEYSAIVRISSTG